ncbi:MAG: hypothetical protein CVV30_04430 [Methanomicrobiales archaeon HGW-Methanomicrobiales-1]|jgi:glycosyltransferase involved in cell wall biosynthesis|nr:MAG: hypothetical protein CVV30_04430 [Methanomicrobiales archaeon HGW-Methanomicrobiales-1]
MRSNDCICPKVAIITGNWDINNLSIRLTAQKLVLIFLKISKNVTVISANHDINIDNLNLTHKKISCETDSRHFVIRGFNHIIYQIKIVQTIFKLVKNQYTVFIFCFGADLFILPLLTLFILKKKILIRTDSRPSTSLQYFCQPSWKIFLFETVEKINYSISDIIIPESKYMVKFYHLERYSNKIFIGPLFVEDYFFKHNIPNIDHRPFDIGYFGRFSEEKGFAELIESLRIISKSHGHISALFIGDGPMRKLLMDIQNDNNLDISVIPWCEKEDIPSYFAKIKLFILPSYKEGLPNSVLESMACGTPVLATPVGGILDVVIDNQTGFIIPNNSPSEIANIIQKALNNSDLNRISFAAREKVMEEYNNNSVLNNYTDILSYVSTSSKS